MWIYHRKEYDTQFAAVVINVSVMILEIGTDYRIYELEKVKKAYEVTYPSYLLILTSNKLSLAWLACSVTIKK